MLSIRRALLKMIMTVYGAHYVFLWRLGKPREIPRTQNDRAENGSLRHNGRRHLLGRENTATFCARRHIDFGTNVPVDVSFEIHPLSFDECVNNT